MTIRVIQRGQPARGQMEAAYDYAYQPFLTSTVQPPVTPDYGAWAARNSHLLTGAWHASRPMAPRGPTVWRGFQGMVQIDQGAPGASHIPSQSVVVRDAMAHPYSRAPRLYGPSLGARLGDVYRW